MRRSDAAYALSVVVIGLLTFLAVVLSGGDLIAAIAPVVAAALLYAAVFAPLRACVLSAPTRPSCPHRAAGKGQERSRTTRLEGNPSMVIRGTPMFGTIARMQLKPGSFEKMQALVKAQEGRQAKGFVFNNVLRSQSNPDEIWLMVGFEDEASYRSNADDPETDKMAQEYQQLMAAPPEWHDGEIVAMTQAENAAGV